MTRRITFPNWYDWASSDTVTVSARTHRTKLTPGPLGSQGLIPGPFVQGQHLNTQFSALSELGRTLAFHAVSNWTYQGSIDTADGVPAGMLATARGPIVLLSAEVDTGGAPGVTLIRPSISGELIGSEGVAATPAYDWYSGVRGVCCPSFEYDLPGTVGNVAHVVRAKVAPPAYAAEVWYPTTSVPLQPNVDGFGRPVWGAKQTVTLAASDAQAIDEGYDWVNRKYYFVANSQCWGGLTLPDDAAAGTISNTATWSPTSGDPRTGYTAPTGRTVYVFSAGTTCQPRYTDDTGGAWTTAATGITCGNSAQRFNVWWAEDEWFLFVPTATANDARLYTSPDGDTWTANTDLDTVTDYGLGDLQTDAGVVVGSLWCALVRGSTYPGMLIVDGPRRRMWFQRLDFVASTSQLWADGNSLVITTVEELGSVDTIHMWVSELPPMLPAAVL